ncbi:MAG: TetR/AcrR family transcriptional regulator [Sporolactobacillus sp.]
MSSSEALKKGLRGIADNQRPGTYNERCDAAANRLRIKAAALRLFEQTAVEQVSMNQIAAEAKVGAGTLYRRYRNKSELCTDLIRDSIERLFSDIDVYLRMHRADLPPEERLKGVLRLFVRFREKKSELLRGVESAPFSSKAFVGSPINVHLHPIFQSLLQEMAGTASPPADSMFMADLILDLFSNHFYTLQRDVRGLTPDEVLDQISQAVLNHRNFTS